MTSHGAHAPWPFNLPQLTKKLINYIELHIKLQVQIQLNFHVMMDLTLWTIVLKMIQEVEGVSYLLRWLRSQLMKSSTWQVTYKQEVTQPWGLKLYRIQQVQGSSPWGSWNLFIDIQTNLKILNIIEHTYDKAP
jgi:hypothetical protein